MTEDEGLGVARDRRIGTQVQGRYRILRKLGEGGMGCVYEGEHLLIRRKVAIKTLHPHMSTSAQAVARFRREAMAATATRNEHVVEVTDMGQFEDDGALFIVLELLEGRNLADEIDAVGAMPLGRVARITCQICEALEVLHKAGIIHRDLKPENLFLIRRGDNPDFVKILDFGISKIRSGIDDQPTQLTAEGMMVGTVHFMSPEQASARPDVDHRTDIYALGGILYTMLAGQLPFDAPTIPLLFMKVVSEPPPPLTLHRSDLPEDIIVAVMRCLAKKPDDRYQSASEIGRVFAKYVAADTPPVSVPSAKAPMAETQRDRGFAEALPTPSRERARPRSGMGVWALVGAVAAAAVLAVITIAVRNRVSELAPAAVVAPPSSPAPPMRDVRVRVWTQPGGAELYLDGAPIPNPFDDERAPSTEEHVLEARLAGATAQQRVRFDRDANVRLTIDVPTAAPVQSAPVPMGGGKRKVTEPARSAEASSQTATVAAPPAESAPAAAPAPGPSGAENDVLGKRKLKRLEF